MAEENILASSDFRPLPFYENLFSLSDKFTMHNPLIFTKWETHSVTLKISDVLTLMERCGIKEKRDFFKTFRILVRTNAADNTKPRDVCVAGFSLDYKWKMIFQSPRRKSGEEFFCAPIDVTDNFCLPESSSNDITCTFSIGVPKTPKPYFIRAFLARKLNVATLLERIKSQPPHPKKLAHSILRHLFNDSSSGMKTTEYKESLLCPLTKQRLEFPVKASTCFHIQCFEAVAFLKINDRLRANWECPVCGRYINYEDLAEDNFMKELLIIVPKYCQRILIWPDLTWSLSDEYLKSDVIDLTDETD